MCYKDRVFCQFWQNCRDGHICKIALTPKVIKDAEEWWGNNEPPIQTYSEKPVCFYDADLAEKELEYTINEATYTVIE